MAGVKLFDALTAAARRMSGCCVLTLNKGIGEQPKGTHVSVAGSGATLTVTVKCATCGTTSVLETDGEDVKVEKQKAA